MATVKRANNFCPEAQIVGGLAERAVEDLLDGCFAIRAITQQGGKGARAFGKRRGLPGENRGKVREHGRDRRAERKAIDDDGTNTEAGIRMIENGAEFPDHIGSRQAADGSRFPVTRAEPPVLFRKPVQRPNKRGAGGWRQRSRIAVG
nr:hypothetical protein [Bradyrhizobium sp. CB1024]